MLNDESGMKTDHNSVPLAFGSAETKMLGPRHRENLSLELQLGKDPTSLLTTGQVGWIFTHLQLPARIVKLYT